MAHSHLLYQLLFQFLQLFAFASLPSGPLKKMALVCEALGLNAGE